MQSIDRVLVRSIAQDATSAGFDGVEHDERKPGAYIELRYDRDPDDGSRWSCGREKIRTTTVGGEKELVGFLWMQKKS